jgi:recombination associated protein RdgC
MWFKNLLVYRFTSPVTITSNELAKQLTEQAFKPCGKQDTHRFGWVPPMTDLSEELYHSANGCMMVCARREEKVLPAAVIKEKLDEKIAHLEITEDRRIYSKEKQNIKDDIIFECLPQAFTKSQRTYAYIDPQQGWLLIDSSSTNKAEELIKLLRQSLGTLPVIPVQTNESPSVIMSGWLQGEHLPRHMDLGSECELQEPSEEGSILRCKRQDLYAPEVEQHLNTGKKVVKLAIDWNESLQCIITDSMEIKRIKFADKLINEADDASDGDRAAQFDADFSVMTLGLREFVTALLNFFGGLSKQESQ